MRVSHRLSKPAEHRWEFLIIVMIRRCTSKVESETLQYDIGSTKPNWGNRVSSSKACYNIFVPVLPMSNLECNAR